MLYDQPEDIPSMTIRIAGVDEVGRGPLAGPVTAAAVILGSEDPIAGLDDSKRLSPKRREVLAQAIRREALAWSVAWATVEEIDRLNILQASLLAMQRAVAGLNPPPHRVLVDGSQCPQLPYPTRGLIGGDRRVPAISAASILAKVARDREMVRLARLYPGYGFQQHKGYPTKAHKQALETLGPSPIHRRSFAPVRAALSVGTSQPE